MFEKSGVVVASFGQLGDLEGTPAARRQGRTMAGLERCIKLIWAALTKYDATSHFFT